MPLTHAELERYVASWRTLNDPEKRIAVLEASAVDALGRAQTRAAIAERAVCILAELPTEPPLAVVERLQGEGVPVERIFCPFGTLEPVSGCGLVLLELAPGVSARELQERCEPTLKIRHDLRELVLDPPPAGGEGGN